MRTGRRVAVALFLGVGLAAAPGFVRGWRLPPLQWDPAPEPTRLDGGLAAPSVRAEGAYLVAHGGPRLRWRAFAPEPVLHVSNPTDAPVEVVVENVHPESTDAGLAAASQDGLERRWRIPAGAADLVLAPTFPPRERYRVAALGDTGGGGELDAFLEASASAGADFVLHLGDFAYGPGELAAAAAALRRSAVPVYAAIGNHDFHRGLDLLHRGFTRDVGPRNWAFRLGGVEFVNLDTAADTWPPDSGERGRLVAELLAAPRGRTATTVLLTHRPILDPRGRGHDLGRAGERAWMREVVAALGVDLLLHGHVHASLESVLDGVPVFVAGGGLGRGADEVPEEGPVFLMLSWRPAPAPHLAARWLPLPEPSRTGSPR